jgi:hypothetical protein
VRLEVFWVGLSSQWLNATHLRIFSMQENENENENGLSRAPTGTTTNAKPSSQFLQYHGTVPALRGPACHAEPPTLSVMLMSHHITSYRTPKVKMHADCCHIVLLRAGAALGRIRVRRNRRLMSSCQRTRETRMYVL